MTVLPQQLDLRGRPILAVEADVPGLGRMALGELGELENVPESDDVLECTIRFVVEWEWHGSNHDKDGTAKDQFRRVLKLKAIKPGFAVTAHVTKSELDEAFYTKHASA